MQPKTRKKQSVELTTEKIKVRSLLKITLPIFFSFILFAAGVFLIVIPFFQEQLMERKKEMIHELNDSSCSLTLSLLADYNRRAGSGELELKDAQKRARERIRKLRYGKDGKSYFWIVDTENRLIMHPHMKHLEGTIQADMKDRNGNYIFRQVTDIAKKQGAGYIGYDWKDWNNTVLGIKKIAYIRLFEPWQWVIAASIPIEDINSETQKISHRALVIFSVMLAISFGISIFSAKQVIRIEKRRRRAEYHQYLDTLRLKKLRQLNRMEDASLEDLVEFTLNEATQLTQSCLGYIVLLSDDEREVTLLNWSKETLSNCCISKKQKSFSVKETHIWNEIIKKRKPIIVNDQGSQANRLKYEFPDGHIKLIRHLNTPIFDKGKIVGVAGVGNKHQKYDRADIRQINLLMDGMWKIIQRKRSETALRESEERYRMIAENATDSIWIFNLADLRVSFISASIKNILGYSPDQIMKMPAEKFITEKSLEELKQTISLELKRDPVPGTNPDRSWEIQLEQINKNGAKIWTEITTRFLRDASGKPDRLIGVTRNINERKQMEVQLMQSQKMEAIGTLAGGIAHDFNNILSAIMGNVELAKLKYNDTFGTIPELDHIFSAGIRARDLVKHILIFSRKQDIEKEWIPISPLLKECLKFLRASIPKSITITQDIQAYNFSVMADPSQIQQVIMNLCTNAAQAIGNNQGLIEIQLKPVEIINPKTISSKNLKMGKYLKLTVTDSGKGIPPGIADRIFDPFFTTKEIGKGTGMGLSIVHGIIKNMGGTVSFSSIPEKGTTFQVCFPCEEKGPEDQKPQKPLIAQIPCTILLVDDEKEIVNSLGQILSKIGYKVVGRTDSLKALETYMKAPDKFDILITDVVMPGMDGIELSKSILAAGKDIPVILSTGFSEGVTSSIIKKAGAFDIIMKPVIVSELAKIIEKALNQTRLKNNNLKTA